MLRGGRARAILAILRSVSKKKKKKKKKKKGKKKKKLPIRRARSRRVDPSTGSIEPIYIYIYIYIFLFSSYFPLPPSHLSPFVSFATSMILPSATRANETRGQSRGRVRFGRFAGKTSCRGPGPRGNTSL